jgi:NADH-quinone oxidoreductase subunit J
MAYIIPPELFEILDLLVLFILLTYTTTSAFLAVSVKSVYHSVLWLIFTLLGIAMIFLLYAESALLLVVQLIVYAGGITVLMLFAITLSGKEAMFEKSIKVKLLDWRLSFGGAFILIVIAFYLFTQVSSIFWQQQDLTGKPSEDILISTMAEKLFTIHGGTLIIVGFLLLAAMLGSVYLVKKEVYEV